jgi:hypothetical protein
MFTKEQGYRPIDLLHAAIDHLFSANALFSMGDYFYILNIEDIDTEAPRCLDSDGYLSHLGIELLLKAFLLFFKGEFPREHSLLRLLKSIWSKGIALTVEGEDLVIINMLDEFFELRYPNPQGPGVPSIGDLDWPKIHRLTSLLLEQLPPELKSDLLQLDRTKKFGRQVMKKPKEGHLLEGHAIIVGAKTGSK